MARRRRKRSFSLYDEKKRSGINWNILKEIALYALYGVVAAFLAVLLVRMFGVRVTLTGSSMMPQLQSGQGVLVNAITYRLADVERGDVIAFYPGGNEDAHPYVKRVVAVGGNTVRIENGTLLIDGIPYVGADDRYLGILDAGIAELEIILQDDEVFVLGDNVNNSEDSRSASIGAVKVDSIIGKVWYALPGEGFNMGKVQ